MNVWFCTVLQSPNLRMEQLSLLLEVAFITITSAPSTVDVQNGMQCVLVAQSYLRNNQERSSLEVRIRMSKCLQIQMELPRQDTTQALRTRLMCLQSL